MTRQHSSDGRLLVPAARLTHDHFRFVVSTVACDKDTMSCPNLSAQQPTGVCAGNCDSVRDL